MRIVPGGSTIREGAFVAGSVVCMPPMYINIGAYVDEGTLVDSHALVGSCAQIGKRVHLSAGAQIGGVIEPVGALPVIIEDDVLVGGNTGVYEGAVIKERAVIAAGVVLTASTPIYDLPRGVIIRPGDGQPLVVPAGAVVVPGARAVTVGAGKEWGLSLVDAGHRQVPRRPHGHTDGARIVDSVTQLRAHPRADRHRLDDRPRSRRRTVHRRARCAGSATKSRSSRSSTAGSTSSPPPAGPTSSSRPTSIACRRSSRAGSRAGCCSAADRATRRARSSRRSRRPSGCAPRAKPVSACCSSSPKSGAARARSAANLVAPGSRFLVNGEPTDNRIATATRGVYRAQTSRVRARRRIPACRM